MLIPSPRHTREDLRVWAQREQMDRRFVKTSERRMNEMERRAMDEIDAFARERCYVGVSWGKDSVVVAHLALRTRPDLPLVWVRVEPGDNPDSVLVRDAFVARWSNQGVALDYREVVAARDDEDDVRDAHQLGWRLATEAAGTDRHVIGVRAEESATRRMSIGACGLSTLRSCRPIGHWQAEHVFAYLYRHDLPVHPAYACSLGGTLDRRHLRVAALGGDRGTRFGRAEWERRYYGDALRALASLRAPGAEPVP